MQRPRSIITVALVAVIVATPSVARATIVPGDAARALSSIASDAGAVACLATVSGDTDTTWDDVGIPHTVSSQQSLQNTCTKTLSCTVATTVGTRDRSASDLVSWRAQSTSVDAIRLNPNESTTFMVVLPYTDEAGRTTHLEKFGGARRERASCRFADGSVGVAPAPARTLPLEQALPLIVNAAASDFMSIRGAARTVLPDGARFYDATIQVSDAASCVVMYDADAGDSYTCTITRGGDVATSAATFAAWSTRLRQAGQPLSLQFAVRAGRNYTELTAGRVRLRSSTGTSPSVALWIDNDR